MAAPLNTPRTLSELSFCLKIILLGITVIMHPAAKSLRVKVRVIFVCTVYLTLQVSAVIVPICFSFSPRWQNKCTWLPVFYCVAFTKSPSDISFSFCTFLPQSHLILFPSFLLARKKNIVFWKTNLHSLYFPSNFLSLSSASFKHSHLYEARCRLLTTARTVHSTMRSITSLSRASDLHWLNSRHKSATPATQLWPWRKRKRKRGTCGCMCINMHERETRYWGEKRIDSVALFQTRSESTVYTGLWKDLHTQLAATHLCNKCKFYEMCL